MLNNHEKLLISRLQKGFTLIEVLVTVLVLAIGLLGLAGLQVTTMRFNHSAYMRSQATNLAYDIADRMRANLGAARNGNYDGGFDNAPTCKNAAALGDLTTKPMAEQDNTIWRNAIVCALPVGTGKIERNAGGIFTITIRWDDSRDSSNPQLFVMTTDL